MPGTGTVTPITPGPSGPSTFQIAEPLPYTLLSLPRFAQYMQINPVHFQGGIGENVFPLGSNSCNDLWPRHSWQAGDRVSHEDLAYTIQEVEQEIANVLRYWPAPMWLAQEAHMYPRFYRRELQRTSGIDATGRRVAIQTNYGKVISPGQRDVDIVGTATTAGGSLVFSDADGDGFIERATIELPTDLTDVCELKVYFAGTLGNQRWEIRPERQKSISSGTVTFIFPSWLFINPDVQSRYPTTERFLGIDLTTTANFVTSVDVYREFTDTTAASAAFYWEPSTIGFCMSCGGAGCAACTLIEQEGCFAIRDAEQGMVAPVPATYSAGAWGTDCFTECREPDQVKFWYYAGNLQNRNLRGAECRMLDNRLGRVIAQMVTARLERPFCNCTVVTAMANKMQRNLALSGAESFQVTEDDLNNPFGTRLGETLAWKYVHGAAEHSVGAVAI